MFKIGDVVKFKSRVQSCNYMIIEAVDDASLFKDRRYKLRFLQGWYTEDYLEKLRS